jgi:hypothetical protein
MDVIGYSRMSQAALAPFRRPQIRQLVWTLGKRPPTEAASRWRSQFTPEPTRGFCGFHRIDLLDHALMNAIASKAFECSDVKARRAGGDPCQHC